METSPFTGEKLQILTYTRHLWALSIEDSLACHTYCDTGHLFIMVISEDPWHSHLMPSVWQWSCHYLFLRLRSVAAGIRTPNLPLARQTATRLCQRRGSRIKKNAVLNEWFVNITCYFTVPFGKWNGPCDPLYQKICNAKPSGVQKSSHDRSVI